MSQSFWRSDQDPRQDLDRLSGRRPPEEWTTQADLAMTFWCNVALSLRAEERGGLEEEEAAVVVGGDVSVGVLHVRASGPSPR